MPSAPFRTRRTRVGGGKCWLPSRPRTRAAAGLPLPPPRHPPGSPQPFVSFHRPHTPFFWPKPIFFSRAARRWSRSGPCPLRFAGSVSPLGDGGRGALLHVPFEQLPHGPVGLGRPSAALSGLERLSPADDPHVALDGREADAKKASSPGRLGHTSLDGFYDPRAQIFGVGLHARMIARTGRLGQRLCFPL